MPACLALLVKWKTGRMSDALGSLMHTEPGNYGGCCRIPELSHAHLPHDLTAELQRRLLVKRRVGKSGRGRESGMWDNITVIQHQMERLSDVVAMPFCNCTVWLTLKWVTA